MSRTVSKKRGFSELPLYRSINMFLLFLTPVIFNLSKDIKQTYGYEIIKMGTNMLVKLRKCYHENNKNDKILLANDICYMVGDVEMLLKILFELGHISHNTQSNISIQIGDILTQLTGWIRSIEKSIVNENKME